MYKSKVLVVEDDAAISNLIRTTLETQEYQYHTAQNGSGALMEVVSYHPDVVILDLGLPDMDGVDIGSVEYNDDLSTNERIEAYRSYNYRQEMLALGARIVLTILIEMLVALLFGFRQKKQLLILAVVNIITQIILNVLLNVINYNSGPLAFTFFYVLFELIVFALEAVLYCTILKRLSEKKKEDAYYILYSFVANLISFGAGLFLAAKLPGMF